MDEQIKAIIKSLDRSLASIPSICRRGCEYCCYQAATLADYEEDSVKSYLKKRMAMRIKSRVRRNATDWLKTYDAIYDEFQTASFTPDDASSPSAGYTIYNAASRILVENKVACPFLIDSRCSIYPVRPLACRTYGQVEDLEACRTGLVRENAKEFKDTAEKHQRMIAARIMETSGQIPRPVSEEGRPVVYHRHLVPAVRRELMIHMELRNDPTLQIQVAD
ncbi:MAG: YkgJ family cysteine cluster protein [Proteobacteria bacterium]|nr:YkgJ family cysteine cluster protein [Pseudomonadota bacterium]